MQTIFVSQFYLIMPNPNKNVHKTNTAETYMVNLFKPVSALFCDENRWLAPPIPAIPSPFGEWSNIKIINNKAEAICIIQVIVSIFEGSFVLFCVFFLGKREMHYLLFTFSFSLFTSIAFGLEIKCALFELRLILSKV